MTAAIVSNAADDSASDSTAWLGSQNHKQAEETPQSNGDPVSTDPQSAGCETQKTCTAYNVANGNTCTSCKDGYAFRLEHHAQKMGSCHTWSNTKTSIQSCVQLNTIGINGFESGAFPGSPELICTKIQLTTELLWLNKDTVPAQVTTDLSSAKGAMGCAVAHCRLWKQTYCIVDSAGTVSCSSRKEAMCEKICKVDSWWGGNAAPSDWGTECSTALCATESGKKYACKTTSMLA